MDLFKIIIGLLNVLLFFGITSCKSDGKDYPEETMVATVFDHNLYYDEVPKDFTTSTNSPDSAALVNAFVDQWVRKMLLLHEAEKRKPESLDIEKLVADYKQSLLINNLERQVITEELDTLVSKQELTALYQKIKENYVQEFPIIRISYFKIPEKAPQIDKFYEWWKKDKYNRMRYYSDKYGRESLIEKDVWREWNDVKSTIDKEVISKYSLKKVRSIQKNIGEYEYFIKVHEFVDKEQISPLGYIEDQIKNIIIQKRKTSVMDEYLERIYLKEIKNKNIVLHNKNQN